MNRIICICLWGWICFPLYFFGATTDTSSFLHQPTSINQVLKYSENRLLPQKQKTSAKKVFRTVVRRKIKKTIDPLAGISLGSGILTAIFVILAQSIDVFGFISILTGLIALGFGIGSLIRRKKNPEKTGKGLAIAGIALGGGWLLILAIVLFFFTGG